MIGKSSASSVFNHTDLGSSLSLRGNSKVIQANVWCDELPLGDVFIKWNFNWLIIIQFKLTCVETFLFGMIENGVQGISLREFLNENLDRDSLLPKLHVSYKLVSLTIVDETEIVSVVLLDHELCLGHLSSVSSNLNHFSLFGDSKRDI